MKVTTKKAALVVFLSITQPVANMTFYTEPMMSSHWGRQGDASGGTCMA